MGDYMREIRAWETICGLGRMRQKGDKYRPVVTVLKVKKGVPTVIKVSGRIYILRHVDQFGGGKNVRDRV